MNAIDPTNLEIPKGIEKEEPKMPSAIAEAFIDADLEKLEGQAEALTQIEFILEKELTKIFAELKEGEELQSDQIEARLSTTEAKSAYKKAMSLVATGESEKVQWWSSFLKETKEATQHKKGALETLEKNEVPKGSEWTGTYLRWGLVLAGAVGTYKVYQWLRSSDKEAKTPYISGALMLMGAGALAGPERVSRWAAQAGLEMSGNSLADFWKNLKNGEVSKAFESFSFNKQNPGIQKTAEYLSIDPRIIINVKDQTVEEYVSLQQEASRKGQTMIAMAAETVGGSWAKWVPGMNLDPKFIEDESKLASFIKANKGSVKDSDGMTVGELLNNLEKQAYFEGKTPEKNAEDGSEAPKIDSLEAHAKSFPTVYEVMSDPNLSFQEKSLALLGAAGQDGASLVFKEGNLFAVNAVGAAYLGSGAILGETFSDLTGIYDGEKSLLDLGWTVMENAGEWVLSPPGATLATIGTAKALLQGKGFNAPISGIISSIKTSYTLIPKTAYQVINKGTQGLELFRSSKAALGKISTSMDNPALAQWTKAQYHIEQYRSYYQHLENLQSKNLLKKSYAKLTEWFTPDFARKMLKKHGNYFMQMEEAYAKTMGLSYTPKVSLDQLAHGSPDTNKALLDAMGEFETKFPASSVPKISGSVKTHLEADTLGLNALDQTHAERLNALGFNEAEQAAIRELKLSADELEDVLKQMEGPQGATLQKALRSTRGREAFKALRASRGWKGTFSIAKGMGAAALLLTAYQYAESQDHANTLGEMAAGAAVGGGTLLALKNGMALAGRSGVKNPYAMAGITVVGGLGGTALWDTVCSPYLEKYYPNREENFSGNTTLGQVLSLATLSSPLSTAQYMDARMSESGWAPWDSHVVTMDETTNPVDYLMEKTNLIYYGETQLRSPKLLIEQAQKAADYYKAQLNTLEGQKNKEALDETIARLESMADPQMPWLETELASRIIEMQTVHMPASEAFANKAAAKYGDAGAQAYSKLIEKVFDGNKHIDEGVETELWRYLADTTVQMKGQAGEIRFLDFAAMVAKRASEIKFLTELKETLPKGTPTQNNGGEVKPPTLT